MSTFSHFIVTRFNLRVTFAEPGTGLDPAWLLHRFQLFDHFCYPSVLGQSNLNFKWLVLFDSDTPNSFKDRVTSYSQWNHFIPVYLAPNDPLKKITREVIMKHMASGADRVVTTRLDSDDGIHRNFVQILQEMVSNHPEDGKPEFINFTRGYIWHKFKLYLIAEKSNPFITFVEPIDGFRTVYLGVAHHHLATVAPVREILIEPLWLQVVHERNVTNRVQGVREPIKALHNFEIDRKYIPRCNDLLSCWLERGWHLFNQVAKKTFRV